MNYAKIPTGRLSRSILIGTAVMLSGILGLPVITVAAGAAQQTLTPVMATPGDTSAITPEAAWETILEKNLGWYLAGYNKAKAAGQETCWDYVKDDPKLPRVLLIGDIGGKGVITDN